MFNNFIWFFMISWFQQAQAWAMEPRPNILATRAMAIEQRQSPTQDVTTPTPVLGRINQIVEDHCKTKRNQLKTFQNIWTHAEIIHNHTCFTYKIMDV